MHHDSVCGDMLSAWLPFLTWMTVKGSAVPCFAACTMKLDCLCQKVPYVCNYIVGPWSYTDYFIASWTKRRENMYHLHLGVCVHCFLGRKGPSRRFEKEITWLTGGLAVCVIFGISFWIPCPCPCAWAWPHTASCGGCEVGRGMRSGAGDAKWGEGGVSSSRLGYMGLPSNWEDPFKPPRRGGSCVKSAALLSSPPLLHHPPPPTRSFVFFPSVRAGA